MSTGKHAATDGAQWYVHADHGRHLSNDRRANSLALIITTSLMFVLLASALMVGGHAIISPLLREPSGFGNTNNRGDIVFTMPDGSFCQHMTFDNTTGSITAGGIDRCDPSLGGGGGDRGTGFRWGSH